MNNVRKIIIVGAGVGGLAAAARLARDGFEVEVVEKNAGPGGRCGRLEEAGFRWDLGPTLLLMPEVVEETFAACGRRMSDYLELTRCDPNYEVHFDDGSSLTCTSDLTAMGKQLEAIEPGSFERYLQFMALGRRQYQDSLDRFVGRNFDSLLQFLTPSNLASVLRIKALKKMYPEVGRFFRDDRLRAALTFQTMYLGISPFEAPAVYGLLPFTELAVGIWFPKGGLYALPLALEKLGRELGAAYRYRAPAEQILIENGRATGVRLEGGEVLRADAVLANADLPYVYQKLLGEQAAPPRRLAAMRYTSSAYMLYLGVSRRFDGLGHHNVYLGKDYAGAFQDIFGNFKVPDDLSFYVNAPAHTDPSLAPAGKDSLYVLVPVPHRHPTLDWAKEGPEIRRKVFARLEREGIRGLEESIEVEKVYTPDTWQTELNLDRGAAFGLSHNFMQVGPFRPANVHPKVKNLMFVGASTQPGTGLPMVMLSAKLVQERVRQLAGIREPVAAVGRPAEVAA